MERRVSEAFCFQQCDCSVLFAFSQSPVECIAIGSILMKIREIAVFADHLYMICVNWYFKSATKFICWKELLILFWTYRCYILHYMVIEKLII